MHNVWIQVTLQDTISGYFKSAVSPDSFKFHEGIFFFDKKRPLDIEYNIDRFFQICNLFKGIYQIQKDMKFLFS